MVTYVFFLSIYYQLSAQKIVMFLSWCFGKRDVLGVMFGKNVMFLGWCFGKIVMFLTWSLEKNVRFYAIFHLRKHDVFIWFWVGKCDVFNLKKGILLTKREVFRVISLILDEIFVNYTVLNRTLLKCFVIPPKYTEKQAENRLTRVKRLSCKRCCDTTSDRCQEGSRLTILFRIS